MRISQKGEELIPGHEDELWPGLRGYAMEHEGSLYIPFIAADEKGKGTLTAFLDDLEAKETRSIKIPNVINGRLAGFLARRGYVLEYEWVDEYQQDVDVWVKRP